jgi:hypothetical protein
MQNPGSNDEVLRQQAAQMAEYVASLDRMSTEERYNHQSREIRNEARADYRASLYRQDVSRELIPRLMRPPRPDVRYIEQHLNFSLYRRLRADEAIEIRHNERRVDFGDGSGYISIDARNVDLADVTLNIQSPQNNWAIRIGGNNVPVPNEPTTPPSESQASGGQPAPNVRLQKHRRV